MLADSSFISKRYEQPPSWVPLNDDEPPGRVLLVVYGYAHYDGDDGGSWASLSTFGFLLSRILPIEHFSDARVRPSVT